MLLKRETLAGIAAGKVTLAYRRWRRPTVKAGGTLRTPIGVLAIESVERIDEADITEPDVHRAGFESLESLLGELRSRTTGELYRIRFRLAGEDPRVALRRQAEFSPEELQALLERLDRLDRRSASGPWTTRTLKLIAAHPGKRAADLARRARIELKQFKIKVRKLKELGLTESLEVGYRLSPRGESLVRRMSGEHKPG